MVPTINIVFYVIVTPYATRRRCHRRKTSYSKCKARSACAVVAIPILGNFIKWFEAYDLEKTRATTRTERCVFLVYLSPEFYRALTPNCSGLQFKFRGRGESRNMKRILFYALDELAGRKKPAVPFCGAAIFSAESNVQWKTSPSSCDLKKIDLIPTHAVKLKSTAAANNNLATFSTLLCILIFLSFSQL